MSSVRMCDRCGRIFSEREDGWTTYQGTRTARNAEGRITQQTATMDECSNCASGLMNVEPRVAISADADRLSHTQTQAERDAALGIDLGDDTPPKPTPKRPMTGYPYPPAF